MRWQRAPAHIYTELDDGSLGPIGEDMRARAHWTPNGALYLLRTGAIREQQTLFPSRLVALQMNEIASIDIDTAEDLSLAEAIVAAGLVAAPKSVTSVSSDLAQ